MRTGVVALVTLIAGASLIAFAPGLALSPAPLSQGHAKVESRCLECHTPGRGAPIERCLACHPRERILADDAPSAHVRRLQDLHRSPAARDCADCHTMHVGRDPTRATHAFRHEVLDAATRAECGACHETQKPRDDLHRTVGRDCASCHSTTAWRPARFEHDRSFVLDRAHAVACATCHEQPGRYRSYTCYGCHEHTPTRIARQHREEGISGARLDDCVRCHRSARDHEGGESGEHGGEHGGGDDD
jgi:hypothetical protein